ncbi:ABC transporter permease [Sandaracinus amylolyticus]|uniref:Uncharacterized protein n=1 Tax=Sandaracinus amylolyticus TaxID=927083 RepID=A0A0F6W201_9BACT|nr:ABC transporter permease [Sandaracinus amylolyticus]AKF05418.1 hypothetical protein DB32_002567 [Sandaracinus amylolyticus]
MIALLRKELRALVPHALLCFLVISGDVISRPLTEQLDIQTWSSISAVDPGEGGGLAFMLALVAFFVAYAAFPREHDDGTIDFLRSLPVTRRAIFSAKMLAGAGVLVLFTALGQVTNWLLQLPNPQSFSGDQFRLDVALGVAALQSTFVLVLYAHGVLASTMRRFGLLPYALVMFVLLAAEEIEPSLAWLNPASICRLAYRGQVLLVPWGDIAVHVPIALVALGISYLVWMGPFEQLRDALAPKRDGRAAIAFGCGTAVVVFVGLAVMTVLAVRSVQENGLPSDEPEGIDWQTAEARTEHYAFVYPTNLRARALRLVGSADDIAESVARVVGAREVPFITVDLAETSAHHEGIAAGTRIRMGLVGQDDDARLRHVLAHESTHVLQGRESDRRLMTQRGTRAFVEGSAEWVAYRVVPNDAAQTESRIVAAAGWTRHRLQLEDVLDDESLRQRFDTSLAYSLGEVLTEGIARACGERAVGDVMRAIGRSDAPQDLEPLALWQDALQSIGCSEVAARAQMERVIDDVARDHADAIAALPRAGAAVTGRDEETTTVVATLDRDAPEGATWTLRVRRDRMVSDTEIRSVRGVVDAARRRVTFLVPRGWSWPRFDLQVCMVPVGGNWSWCEGWTSG